MDFLNIMPPQRHCTSYLCDSDDSVQAIISAVDYTGWGKILTEVFSTDEYVESLDARLIYITHIILNCKETNVPIDTDTFLCPLAERLNINVDELKSENIVSLKTLLHRSTNRYFIKVIEKMTRGQSNNLLWFLVRSRLVTGSSVVKQCSYKPSMTNLAHNIFRPASKWEVFGRMHEPIVRNIIACFIERRPIPISSENTLGLLIDPFSGTFGASIDLCYGVEERDGLICVGDRAHVYEIKCVARYIYNFSDVEGFLNEPTLEDFANIIKGATFPIIEHRPLGNTPSSGTHLVSHDKIFSINRKRKNIYESNDEVKKLLSKNSELKSIIYIMREKKDDDHQNMSLECTAIFTSNIFLNARHKYFDQVSMQYFVLTQHYINDHCDPYYIEPDTLPRVSVVTALFKTRKPGTHDHRLVINGKTYTDCAIPFALIVTPVAFDAEVLALFLRETFNNYTQEVYRDSRIKLWDPNFLRGFVASHRELEKTP
ncbi:alkaline exonuclease [Elephant endotheliotropic herpesvirus 5B]|uniref:Deoxyribonuclease n=27 Tax=Proboscivirus TaxID=548689 RepID=A0A075CYR3_9BETA|nr:deoxyribonuclease [Elephant endotheliotropic herpesvirus 5]AHC02862.1 deoxyribonuclease [Elephant endotheliotropic herpesvirus 5]UVZ35275.1 alkaline exonuclease [Elephant endotheliotropic herpesvirus 5B]